MKLNLCLENKKKNIESSLWNFSMVAIITFSYLGTSELVKYNIWII